MATKLTEWEKITPQELIPAIKHVRATFDDSEWRCSQKLCYSALHPGAADRVTLAPYEEAASFEELWPSSATPDCLEQQERRGWSDGFK